MAEGSGQCLCSYGSRNDACWQESTEYTCRHRLQSSERAPARQKRPACRATASKLLSPAGFKLRSTSVATAMCQLALCIVTLPVLVQVVLDALQRPGSGQSYFHLRRKLSSNVPLGRGKASDCQGGDRYWNESRKQSIECAD